MPVAIDGDVEVDRKGELQTYREEVEDVEGAEDGVRAGAGAVAVAVAGAVDHLSVSTVTHASVSCLSWDMLAPSLSHCRVPSSTAVCHCMCMCVCACADDAALLW